MAAQLYASSRRIKQAFGNFSYLRERADSEGARGETDEAGPWEASERRRICEPSGGKQLESWGAARVARRFPKGPCH